MTAPLVLVLFAVATATSGPRYLLRAGWVQRSPHWGIWAWQAMSLAVALAIFLVGLTLALPLIPFGSHLAEVVRATHLDVTDHYTTPAGNGLATAALVATIFLVGRATTSLLGYARAASRQRSQHLEVLELVGTRDPGGYTVIEHHIPLVYCLPGRCRIVVVTTAAMTALSPQELCSVLAHEGSHLRARHDLALLMADVLTRTFCGVRTFRTARDQVAALMEMQADDAARGAAGRRAMARALMTLSPAAHPSSTTTNSDGVAITRIRRLVGTTTPSATLPQGVAVAMGTFALLAAPLGLALAPAFEASAHDCCPAALDGGPRDR